MFILRISNFMKFCHCLFKILKNQNVADGQTHRQTTWKQYTPNKHSLQGAIITDTTLHSLTWATAWKVALWPRFWKKKNNNRFLKTNQFCLSWLVCYPCNFDTLLLWDFRGDFKPRSPLHLHYLVVSGTSLLNLSLQYHAVELLWFLQTKVTKHMVATATETHFQIYKKLLGNLVYMNIKLSSMFVDSPTCTLFDY